MNYDYEAFNKRIERYAIIGEALKRENVSEMIIGGVKGDKYTVRCSICGWIGVFGTVEVAVKEGYRHDRDRVKWGCPIKMRNA
jgi:hypothetical protein